MPVGGLQDLTFCYHASRFQCPDNSKRVPARRGARGSMPVWSLMRHICDCACRRMHLSLNS
eukprot:6204310-Pleurochrysis_carterae.AAC.1